MIWLAFPTKCARFNSSDRTYIPRAVHRKRAGSGGPAIPRKSGGRGRTRPCSVVTECAKLYLLLAIPRRSSMPQGTVKWFNPTKGYGFIQPQEGGKDVFVHISAVERAGLSTLNEGQTVQFELVENRGKTSAENLKVK